ncbi:hypothetical protein PC116_g28774 [Phytophthora cactorum]|nr:hypothetical protein PC116_g28774 [Phytophthora cactorum]
MRTRKQTREEEYAAEPRPTVVSITKVEPPTISPSRREVSRPSSTPSKLPKLIQFPLVTILSLSLAAVGYSLTWRYTKGPMAPHARLLTTWDDVGIVTGWRVFELALGWFGNYDGYDITALNILSHGPLLPSYLVVYFTSLPTIASAHETTYVGLLPVTLALGFAARAFIFTPAEATASSRDKPFDPVSASLRETVRWNFWGWSAQTKVVIQRTALLMLISGADTFVQTRFTVKGVETPGAAAWSSVWVIAAAVTGLALGAVGSV